MRALVLLIALTPAAAQRPDELRVVTTLGVLADVARAVGGARVTARALARPGEDPHHVVGTPALMAAVAAADLFVEVGLSLEVWTETVLEGAGNAQVRRGASGHVVASEAVARLGVPAVLTRAAGDVHPEGNPHIWFDPVAVRQIAANVAKGLARVAPAQREAFERGAEAFQHRLDEALYGKELVELLGGDVLARLATSGSLTPFLAERTFRGETLEARVGGWLGRARALRGVKIVAYHDAWAHFAARFAVEVVGFVEEKPGIAPSAAHRDALLARMREQAVRIVVVLPWDDDTVARQVAEASGARLVELPGDVGGAQGPKDYFGLVDTLLERLIEAAR